MTFFVVGLSANVVDLEANSAEYKTSKYQLLKLEGIESIQYLNIISNCCLIIHSSCDQIHFHDLLLT